MKKLLLICTLVVLTTVCFSQDKIKLASDQIKSEIVTLKKIQEQNDEDFKRTKKAHKKYQKELKAKIKEREKIVKAVKALN